MMEMFMTQTLCLGKYEAESEKMVWTLVNMAEERRRKREADRAGWKEWECSHYRQPRSSTHTTWSRPHLLEALWTYWCHPGGNVQDSCLCAQCLQEYCHAWHGPIPSGEGNFNEFFPVMLNDNMQDVHIISSSGLRHCLVIFKLSVNPW